MDQTNERLIRLLAFKPMAILSNHMGNLLMTGQG